jgi:hypothetical protein
MATTTPNRGYQLPAAGSKLKDDVLRLIAALSSIDADVAALLTAMADKTNVGHDHGMGDITGLVAALDAKLDAGFHDALENLSDVDVAGVANGMALLRQASKWIPVALQINNIAGLETALNSKATQASVTAAINTLIGAAPGALDTLKELSDAIGADPNFASTMATALGSRLRVDAAQALTEPQKTQGRANLGVSDLATSIAAGSDAAFGDGDELVARKADGSIVRRAWLATKSAVWTALGALIAGGTAKATPVDGDMIAIADSAASNATKKVTLTSLWANYLKAKTDALYLALVSPGSSGNVLTSNGSAWVSSAPAASGQPIPTSSTFAVGTMVIGASTAASTVDGATVAGSIFFLVQLIQGNPGQVTSGGYVNYGTWKNISGTTVPANRHAYWVRVA